MLLLYVINILMLYIRSLILLLFEQESLPPRILKDLGKIKKPPFQDESYRKMTQMGLTYLSKI